MEQSPFPEIKIVDPIGRIKKIAHFLLNTDVPMHMSNHYERPHFEPTDGEAFQPELPFDKQRAVAHYVQMAQEARS